MLMPKKNRVQIFEYLFKEGVLVVKKDPYLPQHAEIAVPNLHVMKACQSLKSCGHVRENYTWQHYYYILTNEGIQYLRDYLHLPPEIVPATLKRQTRPVDVRARPKVDEPRRAYSGAGDREAYRRGGQGDRAPDKKADAGAGTATFEFRGGYGRGRGAP
ncbi:small ribosomal subunit protein eS10-like [Styela clava]|uniref:40S ribosomal protein S10-like n=1 Tax=Styela clava TaxID=7725 RepID=UPI0019397797|nr:40S ribosomal protein S10-like [Styela clava]